MKPIEFEGHNAVYGADQPQYLPLPGRRLPGEGAPLVTCWELDEADVLTLQRTRKLWLKVLTFDQALPPLLLSAHEQDMGMSAGEPPAAAGEMEVASE